MIETAPSGSHWAEPNCYYNLLSESPEFNYLDVNGVCSLQHCS